MLLSEDEDGGCGTWCLKRVSRALVRITRPVDLARAVCWVRQFWQPTVDEGDEADRPELDEKLKISPT